MVDEERLEDMLEESLSKDEDDGGGRSAVSGFKVKVGACKEIMENWY